MEFFGTPLASHLGAALLRFLGALAAGWILKRFLVSAGRRLISRTETDLDDRILAVLLPRITWLAIAVGAYLAIDEVARTLTSDQTTVAEIVSYVRGIVFVVFVWVVTVLTLKVITILLRHILEQHARRTGSELSENLVPLLSRIAAILIISFAVLTVLGQFGVNINSLLVFLGGGSFAIAFAAQETLANMIAGFLIMLDRPFRAGDRIKLPSGEVGDVQEIGLRTTRILDFDNNLLIVPNAELIKSRVINFAYPQAEIKVSVDVGVAYGTDLQKARSLITAITTGHPDILSAPAPEVFVTALADSSVNLTVVARTGDYKRKWAAETAIREKIYTTFLTEGIEIPFPQRVVHLEQKHG